MTDGKGNAPLAGFPEHTLVKVTKAGYAPASFRPPHQSGRHRRSGA